MSAAMRCDNCGTFAASEVEKPYSAYAKLPVGWLRIFVQDQPARDQGEDPKLIGEVCSRRCGSAWLEKA